ncbi:MAG: BolA family transcriptional regulator [Parvibaculum sp.]|uniref:BolA family protein n=1 Tax=Parvibaculum sp. TaxID=2024848 RepID=UPI001D305B76|nr:BolA family protein [Parvibaculum sp.]MBX3489323.1 BolA family transcriptional regulator [Parvibaculum sp.]MBX3495624.1 BolA family transcriptional regulator [Parvibaculum sp.]MCW5726721.1 BolA family transcriptional regulator [Parvibaculum sp.]
MSVAETMRRKLEAALAPTKLEIEDQSHLHKGHAGHRPGGESHFRVVVVAPGFAGKSRVERQRMVTTALKDEMGHPIHALGIKAMTPEEAEAG